MGVERWRPKPQTLNGLGVGFRQYAGRGLEVDLESSPPLAHISGDFQSRGLGF